LFELKEENENKWCRIKTMNEMVFEKVELL